METFYKFLLRQNRRELYKSKVAQFANSKLAPPKILKPHMNPLLKFDLNDIGLNCVLALTYNQTKMKDKFSYSIVQVENQNSSLLKSTYYTFPEIVTPQRTRKTK